VPLVATGATLYSLYLVLVVVVGRSGRTGLIFPVTATAAAVNLGLNLVLVPDLETVGAGLALVGSYLVMLTLMYAVTRRLFPVPFQWARLARIVVVAGGLFALGETLLPAEGAAGFLSRAALLGAYPLLLWASGFFERVEIEGIRAMVARMRARGEGSVEAAEDLKTLRGRTELMDEMHDA
jgi:O-antigen/teichoic acid export membrane protein